MERVPPLCVSLLGSLALVLSLVSARDRAPEHATPGWRADGYSGGRVYARPPECVDIPRDLRLCHNIGYSQMLLPNLLGHESAAEVLLQASSWVPLVLNGCHPGTQVLLCSLFAPVCLERAVPPCRWLCEAVRQGCQPVLDDIGYPWPDMLACDKFPQDEHCIVNTTGNGTQNAFTGETFSYSSYSPSSSSSSSFPLLILLLLSPTHSEIKRQKRSILVLALQQSQSCVIFGYK